MVISVLLLIASFTIFTDDSRKNQVLLQVLTQSLQSGHFAKHELNDKFSEDVYHTYLKRLDYSKRFFLKKDIELFNKYKNKIDDEINATNYDFYDLSVKTLKKRQKEVEKIYKEFLTKPFNFNIKEKIEMDPDKRDYPKNKKERKEYWRKFLKHAVLEHYADFLQVQKDAIERKDSTYEIKSENELEEKARNKVLETYNDWFYRLNKIKDEEWLAMYLNSIASIYDPHTEYLPPKDKENFDIVMSGKFEGIGATLQQRRSYIKVVRIVPGSASWKQGELEVNDVILKVGQGKEEPVSIVDMDIDDAVKLIRGKKGTEVRLTVKKIDGTVKIIPIIRDEVVLEETYAKSSIVTDPKSGIKAGYIYLPRFYTDFKNKNGRTCSKDVEKEINKLKKDGVSGIILDLRNNGGGSLRDVIDMSGLFIESGPIVQVKGRYGPVEILKDLDARVQYKGPLVIMVNNFSASASEILSAALQDYDRAIIMGSKSTYGKGTVQRFYDFDQIVRGNEDLKPFGVIKMTTQKFYRIDGGTTQLKGVIPDIIFPDNYLYIKTGEKEMDHAMKWDQIENAAYNKWKPDFNKNNIIEASNKRIKSNKQFQLITEYAQILKEKRDDTEYSLKLKNYQKENDKEKKEMKKYNKIGKSETGLAINFISSEKETIEKDSSKFNLRNAWHKNLQKDIYLYEAVNVIKDLNK